MLRLKFAPGYYLIGKISKSPMTHRYTILTPLLGLVLTAFGAQGQTSLISVQRVAVVGSERGLGVQITSTQPVSTEAQALSGPDRIVIDFPGAVPGQSLRGLSLNQGLVKSVRVGLFRSNPPVTRVVVDLNSATPYQLISNGNNVTVKLGQDAPVIAAKPARGATLMPVAANVVALAPAPATRVSFRNGLLSIAADNATLADVLYQVHLRTGADIAIPSGAEQEKVVIQVGPGKPKEVMAALLNGSRFNFVLQGSASDPDGIGTVLLTPRTGEASPPETAYTPPANPAPEPEAQHGPTPPPNAGDPQHPMGPPVMANGEEDGDLPATNAVQPEAQMPAPSMPPSPPMQPDPNTPPNPEEPQE